MKTLPLKELKVVDLSRVLAGPLCTMMLADLGAHVLKVERPRTGDDTRGWGPPFADDGQSAYFRSVNRNKLSVALDLDEEADADRLRTLIADCDVVVENFLPGALARKGIDALSMLAAHPRLVWCSISGFGPLSQRPGYDFVVQAESGWMSITGPADGAPHKVGVALADVIAGKDAAAAILAALIGRDHLAVRERHLHIALRDSATAALVNVAQNALVTGDEPLRWGNAHPNLVPYQLFDASDRAIVLAVGSEAQWEGCVRALALNGGDLPEAHADALRHADEDRVERAHGGVPTERFARWRTNAGRVGDRERLVAELARTLASRPAHVWMQRLAAEGVPCGLVLSVREALESVSADAVTGVAPAAGGTVRTPPPQLDEHGALVRARGWAAFDVTMPPVRTTARVTL